MQTKDGIKLSEKDVARLLLYKGIQNAVDNLEGDVRALAKVMTKGQLEKVQKHADAFIEALGKKLLKGSHADDIKAILGL
jgi:hypothetical protein